MNAFASAQSPTHQFAQPAGQPHVEPQVSRQIGVLSDCLKSTVELVKNLEARLGPILRTQPEQPPPSPGAPQEFLVPVADVLRGQCHAAGAVHFALSSMLDRIEL